MIKTSTTSYQVKLSVKICSTHVFCMFLLTDNFSLSLSLALKNQKSFCDKLKLKLHFPLVTLCVDFREKINNPKIFNVLIDVYASSTRGMNDILCQNDIF